MNLIQDLLPKVIFPNVEVEKDGGTTEQIQPGDYVSVMITDSSSQVLKGIPLRLTTLQGGTPDLNELDFIFKRSESY